MTEIDKNLLKLFRDEYKERKNLEEVMYMAEKANTLLRLKVKNYDEISISHKFQIIGNILIMVVTTNSNLIQSLRLNNNEEPDISIYDLNYYDKFKITSKSELTIS